MKRIKSLKFENKLYFDINTINNILIKNGFYWINNAEIENAYLEIKDDKLYWLSGVWYYGTVDYIIWLDGIFKYGEWLNGVFYNGVFENGKWLNGVFMNGVFKGGEFLGGEFRDGIREGGTFKIDLSESVKSFTNYIKK